MAAPTIDLSKYKPASSTIGGVKAPAATTPAKKKYADSLSTLNLTGVGAPPQTGITNKNVLPDYLRNDGGATSPLKAPAPSAPSAGPSQSGPGTYQGVAITPGNDSSVAQQISSIDRGGYSSALQSPSAQRFMSSTTPGTSEPTAPPRNGNTSTGNGTNSAAGGYQPSTSYSQAMSNYLSALGTSNKINEQLSTQTLDSNRGIQDAIDKPGGTTAGARDTANLFTRRANANLGELGIAQQSATNAADLAFRQLEFEKGNQPNNDPYTLSPGQTRFDAQGNPIASVADTAASGPASVQEYQYAQQQGYTGSFDQWKNQGGSSRVLSASEAQSLGVPFGTTADQAYGITPTKPLTEAQAKDLTYGQRTQEANTIIDQLANDIVNFNSAAYAGYGALEPNAIGNTLVPDVVRQYKQAERNFLTAVLRRESGASISPSEFYTAERQYFPRPGDDEQTLAQKKQLRDTAISSFMASGNPQGQGQGNYGGGSSGSIWDF